MPDPTAAISLNDWSALKSRFKELQAQTNNVFQNWQIRVHRGLFWLQRASQLPDDQLDVKFMLLWVSFNALYSRWDGERNAPAQDSASRNRFIERVCEMDHEIVGRFLSSRRAQIKRLLENFYLSNTFWRDPNNPKAKGWAAADANYLDRNLKEKNYCKVLEQVGDRLYVMRGQLIHGAATGGGRLNRQTLKHCLDLMIGLLPLFIRIVLEHGASDDWPDLCYPPLQDLRKKNA